MDFWALNFGANVGGTQQNWLNTVGVWVDVVEWQSGILFWCMRTTSFDVVM